MCLPLSLALSPFRCSSIRFAYLIFHCFLILVFFRIRRHCIRLLLWVFSLSLSRVCLVFQISLSAKDKSVYCDYCVSHAHSVVQTVTTKKNRSRKKSGGWFQASNESARVRAQRLNVVREWVINKSYMFSYLDVVAAVVCSIQSDVVTRVRINPLERKKSTNTHICWCCCRWYWMLVFFSQCKLTQPVCVCVDITCIWSLSIEFQIEFHYICHMAKRKMRERSKRKNETPDRCK